ncbi:MAG: hypothetical protein FJ368_04395 [Pelagibacterales bacterium]|nr:hypothetical protein [Pelagibacterales bacterium]
MNNSEEKSWQEVIKKNQELGDQNFIKKDESFQQEEQTEEQVKNEISNNDKVQKVIANLKKVIFPKNNQQRNLSKEVGGLETKKSNSLSSEDIWDNRSEEVDKMGSTDNFNTSEGRSFLWWKKRQKVVQRKFKELAIDAIAGITIAKSKTTKVKKDSNLTTNSEESFVKRAEKNKSDHNSLTR